MKKIFLILLCLLLLTGCSKTHSAAVPNEKAAKAVARAYFDEMEKNEITQTFVVDDVFYDSEKEAWVVVFWHSFFKAWREPLSTGSLYITVGEKDGEILSVFFGEFYPGEFVS